MARYLKGTRNKGMIYRPELSHGLEIFFDADFSGNWEKNEAPTDRDIARSRHGYFIIYTGCSIVWKSQLQTKIASSSTESKYIELSYALREAIPIMELLKEIQQEGQVRVATTASIHLQGIQGQQWCIGDGKATQVQTQNKAPECEAPSFLFIRREERGNNTSYRYQGPIGRLSDQASHYDILSWLCQLVVGW